MGQIKLGEEASTPDTPADGVIIFPTAATPSVLTLIDDAGNVYTLMLLEKAQTVTGTLTLIGSITSAPSDTTKPGINIAMPAGFIAGAVDITDIDNGASFGPFIRMGRNNNAATPAACFFRMRGRAGSNNDLWPDETGVLRIGVGTTSITDLGGTVVGAQTSSLDTKDVVSEFIDNGAALRAILATPLYRFRYKDNRYNQEFVGVITDHAPLFGIDRDEKHPAGRSLNEINAHGYSMAAIKALAEQVAMLAEQVTMLTEKIRTLTDANA